MNSRLTIDRDPVGETGNRSSRRNEQASRQQSFVTLDSMPATQVEWLFQDRIPLGAITLLEGDPGKGKSSITCDLIARVTRGRLMPGEQSRRSEACSQCASCRHNSPVSSPTRKEPRGVVLIQAEDHLNATVIPRLQAAGADLQRIKALHAADDGDQWKLRDGIQSLENAIVETNAALVVIDPLPTFLSTGSHSDQKVREELQPLASLAERTAVAILIVRHLVKETGRRNVAAGAGSIAIIGQARSALASQTLPDNFDYAKDVVPFSRTVETDFDTAEDSVIDRRFTHLLSLIKSNLGHASPLVYRTRQDNTGAVAIEWLGTYEPGQCNTLSAPPDVSTEVNDALTTIRRVPSTAQKLRRRAWRGILNALEWAWTTLWEYATRLVIGVCRGAARGIKRGRGRKRRRRQKTICRK